MVDFAHFTEIIASVSSIEISFVGYQPKKVHGTRIGIWPKSSRAVHLGLRVGLNQINKRRRYARLANERALDGGVIGLINKLL